ncbi:AfsR/SARP family transcriptional regulator [Amycolatopsis kentuckyensis]|uniref:AfsR/SARP family transcriptional regulator n=1 Tax=Amycolatopsis kentuckyensis TaxID=218823 RepID=UPI001FC9AEEA|nr:BTAD domain-containing putative transcriptional regulator [Amycolatopsis kentuckyensis]
MRGQRVVTSVRLLGEVAVLVDGCPVDLGTPRQRCILAVLALEAGQVVATDRLVERVWGADVTPRTRTTLHGYISRLRAALAGAHGIALLRRSGGYVLVTDPRLSTVDLHRFRELHAKARSDGRKALTSLTDALELWQGEALTGLAGEWAEAERERLERERPAAWQDLVDTRLRLGIGADLVAELAARTGAHPLDERLAGQYMLALHQAGRTADALEHYRRVRVRLVEELGADPGAALQDRHRQILTARPSGTGTSPPAASGSGVPRELLAAPASFVGRQEELHRLDAAMDAARSGGTPMLSAITGAGGLGKTWLARRWAHHRLDRFPDGQLFVDLRGYSPDNRPMAPATALRGFLTALGVEAGSMPPETLGRSALFRSLTAGRRILVVLDNAAGTDQVVPLLPGGGSCAVVVTSRNQLAGLVIGHDALRVPLHVLSDGEARGLLGARLGTTRVEAEHTAVDELVGLCGGLPLALSVIAGRAGTPLSAAVSELRESGLDGLADDDPSASLPAVLSWSYRALTEEQATAFGVLAGTPGPDTGLPAAANLTGLAPARAKAVLRSLEQASLLEYANGRYRMHDLVRAYAARQLPAGVRDTAVGRVLDFYAHTAHAAGLALDAHRGTAGLSPPAPGTHVHTLPDAPAAMAWFEAEHATLLAARHTAVLRGDHHTVWWLALSSDTFHQRQGHRHDRLAGWRAAAHAAAQLSSPTPQLVAHRYLGRACVSLALHEEAIDHLHHAIALAEEHDDPYELGHAHQSLAQALELRDLSSALDHATQALRLFHDLGLPLCRAHGHNAVGWYTARLGDHDTARGHFDAALALHRDQRNPAGEANSLDRLGYLEYEAGHHESAIRNFGEALALRRALGNVSESAATLDHLGPPHLALGRHDEARAVWQEAQQLYRRQGREEEVELIQRHLGDMGTC